MDQGLEHDGNESQPMVGGESGSQPVVIPRKAVETGRPGKGTIHYPASGQQHKPTFGFMMFFAAATISSAVYFDLNRLTGLTWREISPYLMSRSLPVMFSQLWNE